MAGTKLWCFRCGVTEAGLAKVAHPSCSPFYGRYCTRCRSESFACAVCHLPVSYKQYVNKTCPWCARGFRDAREALQALREYARTHKLRAVTMRVREGQPWVQFDGHPPKPLGRPVGQNVRRAMAYLLQALQGGREMPTRVLYERANVAGIPAWALAQARERLGVQSVFHPGDARGKGRYWSVRLPHWAEQEAEGPALGQAGGGSLGALPLGPAESPLPSG